jgi:hypothetical protein
MYFKKKEALDHCQDCGSGRPNFCKSGAYDPNCLWPIANKPSRCTMAYVDKDNKERVLSEIFRDMMKCEVEMGQNEANLVAAVQNAQQSYLHIVD